MSVGMAMLFSAALFAKPSADRSHFWDDDEDWLDDDEMSVSVFVTSDDDYNEYAYDYDDYDDYDYDSYGDSTTDVDGLFLQEEVKTADNARVQKLYDLLTEKTDSILYGRSYDATLAEKIAEIEGVKQEIAALLKSDVSDQRKAMLRKKMQDEINERSSQKPRAAEVNPDGSLNDRGLQRLANDIEKIQEKYSAMETGSGPDAESVRKADSLRKKLSTLVSALEGASFKESSAQGSGISLSVQAFTKLRGNEGWPYTVSYRIDGTELFSVSGILSYEELSGKKIPEVPSVRSADYDKAKEEYENFLDSVEVFNAAFEDGLDFVEAVLSLSVKTGRDPSSYRVSVENMSLKNVVNGKNVCSFNYRNNSKIYQSEPAIDVELEKTEPTKPVKPVKPSRNQTAWQDKDGPFDDSSVSVKKNVPKVEDDEVLDITEDDRNPPKVERQVRTDSVVSDDWNQTSDPVNVQKTKLQKKRDSYSSILYVLPGNFNAYLTEDDVVFTLGYSLTFGVAEHFYLGLNAEVGAGVGALSTINTYDEFDNFDNYGKFVLTGIAGWNWSLSPSCRFSVFCEGGFFFDTVGLGTGVSAEIASVSSNVALQTSCGYYYTSDMRSIAKASLGMEILF